MKVKKLYEFSDTQTEIETKSDISISQNVYDTYMSEFKKSHDIWKSLESTADVLGMSENDVYNHITKLGEGSMFENKNEELFENQKFDKIMSELSYQRKKLDKIDLRIDKIDQRLEETVKNLNNTNQFIVDLIKKNNLIK